MTAELVAEHVARLAEKTAHDLAKRSKIDIELRSALVTAQLDDDTVRIGKCDIGRQSNDLYSISPKDGSPIICDLFYYETALALVGYFNKGILYTSKSVSQIIRINEQYLRLITDIRTYREQIEFYEGCGREDRAELIDNRLSEAMGRAGLYRQQLLNVRL